MVLSSKIKLKTIMTVLVVVLIVLVLSVAEKVNPLFALIMVMWIWMFAYSVINIRKTPLLFCFLISFFVFLLGRQVCYHYLHIDQVYEFLDIENNHTYLCIVVSFVGIIIGLFVSTARNNKTDDSFSFVTEYKETNKGYQQACKIVFYLCYLGTMAAVILQVLYVRRVGYLGSYSDDSEGPGIPTIISYLSKFTPIALCMYLGTKPSKRKVMMPLLLYEVYALSTLITGQRYPFIGINMLILVYYVLRAKTEKGWIKKYHKVLLIISIPLLMLFLTAYDSIRLGKEFSMNNFLGTMEDFFIQQGGSINVIRRTIHNADQLKDMHLVSFQSTYSAIFENAIGRRLFNITTYSGNSIERAFQTNDLAHRLSYIAYGNAYLSGKGTGTSYIAELLHDFGLVGVFFGNCIYGLLLTKIDRIRFSHSIYDGIKLAMIYYILFAPRGGFDSFIGSVFTFQFFLGVATIILITSVLNSLGKDRKAATVMKE